MNIYKFSNNLGKEEGEWKMNRWFNNSKNNYNYIQEYKSSENVYDNFAKWIAENIKDDKNDILKSKLEYLYETYSNLLDMALEELSTELRFKLMVLNNDSTNKLEKYTDNRIKEHVFIKNKKIDKYKKYTDLASWYVNVPQKTNKVINTLYKVQQENKYNLKSDGKTTKIQLNIEQPAEMMCTVRGE